MDERATTTASGLLIESKWLAILGHTERIFAKATRRRFWWENLILFLCAQAAAEKSAFKNKHHQQLYQQSDIFTVLLSCF